VNWEELYLFPPESVRSLWYCPSINRFSNEDGDILHDLHDFFDVWQLEEWKRTQNYGILLDRNGDWWELFYPSNII
jgi:hypothetical protein